MCNDFEHDDVGTCPRCGEDSTGASDVCHNCREQEWLDSEESSPYTPFG